MGKAHEVYNDEEEQAFLEKNILGLKVTSASTDAEHFILEFDDRWRVVICGGSLVWERRKPS